MASTLPSYGQNSFVPPSEPPPLRIAVWVGNKQKLVTGLVRTTTCEDVVQALVHQEQLPSPDQWVLYEAWGKEERPLRGRAKVAKVLRSWGEDLPYVKFSMRRRGTSMSRDYSTGRSISNPSLAASNFDIPPQQRSVSHSTLPHNQHNQSNQSLQRSTSCSSISSQEDMLSQSRREANAEAINKLLSLMQDQDKKLKEQMERIHEVERQIEEHETEMHMSRIQEDGVDYIQAGYLIPSDDGSSGSGSPPPGDETMLGAEEDVPEAEAYVTICEEVSRVEEQLEAKQEHIKSLSMLIKEASQGVTGGLSDTQSLTGNQSALSQRSLSQQGSDSQAGLEDKIQQEIKTIKEAMKNSLYVSMSQEEQMHKMNQALNDMHQQLKGKEQHLNQLLQELENSQTAGDSDNVESNLNTTADQDNQTSHSTAADTTEYSMLRDNPLGGSEGLLNNILLQYKQNLEQIQAAVHEDTSVNNTSINNTSSSSDDSHDSGISGSDPEKDSDCGSSTGNSPEKQPSPEPSKLSSLSRSVPSVSDISQHQHLSQISVICQNSTMTNETLPNDTLQPLEVLVDKETVLTSTPVQVHSMELMASHPASRAALPSSRGLLDQVRLQAHLAQAAVAANQTDDGKSGQEDEGVGEEEDEHERDVTLVETPADDTYAMLCVRQHAQQSEEEEEEEEDANNTFKMPLKSPMPARKRVAFAERDSIREITRYSMNTTMLEDSVQEEVEQPMDSINITQDLTNLSGDVRCWGMACSSSKKKYTVNKQMPPPLPPRNQPSHHQPDRFLVTLHPHATIALSQQQPGSAPPTPLTNHHTGQIPSQTPVTSASNGQQPPEEQHLENESYRIAVYNFSPANESSNNYLSSTTGQMSMVLPSKSAKTPAKSRLFKLSSSGVASETGKKEASKKLPFVKRFKMPWHSEKKANKEVKIQVLTEKSLNHSEFYDTFNDSYRHALTLNAAGESEVKSKPSVGEGEGSSTFAARLVTKVQRGGEKDNKSNTQGVEAGTPLCNLAAQSTLRHSFSESHIRSNSTDTNLEVAFPKQSGSQSATTTPRKNITSKKPPSYPGTPKTPTRTPRRVGNESLAYTPLGRSYTMPEISKIGYSWIYQYEEDSPLNCSGGPELDATLMETDCRQSAEQCSPGSNSAGFESEGEAPNAPIHGRDMIPYCTYSTFDKAHEDCNSDTGLSSMNSDDLPVLETLV